MRFFKFLLKSLVLFLALLGIATIVLRVIFPPSKLRQLVQDKIRQQIHREAEIGPVQISPFGLTLGQLRLSDIPDFSKGTFLTVDKLRLRWALLPLLTMDTAHRSFTLQTPQVAMLHTAEGKELAVTLTGVQLTLSNFNATQSQGNFLIAQIHNPVYTGTDLSVEWVLKNVDPSFAYLNGWLHVKQGKGQLDNISQWTSGSPGTKLVLLPVQMLQNIDRLGFINLGLPDFSHLAIKDIVGEYDFKDGKMAIKNFVIQCPDLSIQTHGLVELSTGALALEVELQSPRKTLLGEMNLKMQISGTLAHPVTHLDSLKKKVFKATLKQFLRSPENVGETVDNTLKNIFK